MAMSTTITPVSTMTSRERTLAALKGEEVDRFPVWLKMAGKSWQGGQPQPYRSMEALTLLEQVGCDPMMGVSASTDCWNSHIAHQTDRHDAKTTTVIQTPDGELHGVDQYDNGSASWHPVTYLVETKEDLARMRWVYRDTEWSVDEASVARASARQTELAERGVVTMASVGPSPLMNLMQHIAGPVNAIYLMADAPELCREVMDLMHRDRLRQLNALLPHTHADTFWMTENTSTSLISPDMFRELCVPHLTAYTNLMWEFGRIPVHHMCGTLKALLEIIDELPAAANEAYTTPPVGDVTLAEGRKRMPSKALIGGTNAALWLKPVDEIVEEVARDLAACPDRRRIFLTSAGVLPPAVSFEKARAVVAELKRL